MTVGDCFAGIGGFSLAWHRLGCDVRWQIECDWFARQVLQLRFPGVKQWGDVRLVDPSDLKPVDLICGGFPCVDISSARTANARRGLAGRHSGLWTELHRLIVGVRPRWALIENSPEWRRWVPQVRADLARDGYASVPVVVSAAFVGAPHARPRAFVVAHADGDGESLRAFDAEMARLSALVRPLSWPNSRVRLGVDDGLSYRLDRLAALGNAVCPQVIELIGSAILSADGGLTPWSD